MEFIDLARQQKVIKEDLDRRLNKVFSECHFIMGPEIKELEEQLASFCNRKYCLTCSNGTDALIIPMMAYGLNKEDAVFVPTFTYFASAESVISAGGTPVFVDIDDSFNIDPNSLEKEIQKVISEGNLIPKGIIPVDLFGRSADYDSVLPIAEKYNLFVLEDSAQGFGGSLHGKRNGAFGDVSATSFFPAKPLGCYGDGGAIFTDDDYLYDLMQSIRVHGQGGDRYDNIRFGMNGRFDTVQAAVVLSKLGVFEEELEKRQQVAKWYEDRLKNYYETPIVDEEYYSSWAQYTLKAKDLEHRDEIVKEMKQYDIPIMIYYPIPMHMQTAFKYLNYQPEELPCAFDASQRVFSVPMHPYLKEQEVDDICTKLIELA